MVGRITALLFFGVEFLLFARPEMFHARDYLETVARALATLGS